MAGIDENKENDENENMERKAWCIEGLLRMTWYKVKTGEEPQLDQDWCGIWYEEHASGPKKSGGIQEKEKKKRKYIYRIVLLQIKDQEV